MLAVLPYSRLWRGTKTETTTPVAVGASSSTGSAKLDDAHGHRYHDTADE
jgi:hypothetical protein